MTTNEALSLIPPDWDVVDWEAEWQRLSDELNRLEADKARIEKEIANLRQERSVKEKEDEELATEIVVQRAHLNHICRLIKEKNTEMARLNVEEGSLRVKLADLSDDLKVLQAACDAKKKELDALSGQITAVRQREIRAQQRENNVALREIAATQRQHNVAVREGNVAQYEANVAARERQVSNRENECAIREQILPNEELRAIIMVIMLGLVVLSAAIGVVYLLERL